MDDQTKNLILAFALSLAVIMGWFALFPPAEPQPGDTVAQSELLPPPAATPALGADGVAVAEPLAETARIEIDTPRLAGSIAVTGGRFDDIRLRDYTETVDPESDLVHLLNPNGGNRHPFYAFFGWSPRGALDYDLVPGPATPWQQVGNNALTLETPVTLQWDNGAGLNFTRVISVDADYMFTVAQEITNTSDTAVSLDPYSLIAQHGVPSDIQGYYISHEGLVQMTDGALLEADYGDMVDYPVSQSERIPTHETTATTNGWIGFTSKYFMATLVGAPGQPVTSVAQYVPGADIYQASLRQPTVTVQPGETASASSMLFTGAKEFAVLNHYQNDDNIERFTDAIDWGWFFFLTRPIFRVLNFYHGLIGNMGWAILALTLTLKAVLLPLAWKSYVSMARMKELQPEMAALKDRAGDDRQKLQQEMMKLYREKKVNPAAGCLPILLQIPIFFSLYKVIFVTIELRHAPWFWVFNDLSAPDPTSLFNLFGALPWAAPETGSLMATVFLGLLPLLFGASMWFQMRLNPAPADPMQATIFNWMPWIFMFVMGGFASGLLMYWIGNNVITFTQQYFIMRAHGSKPDIFGNIRASVRLPKGSKPK
ncbi:membrane protein insertase YidC [Pararhodobacter zhoushanensis]|uniref:Membrane protein insertase YidC n=1 Tax=Pararhodobacter zhoushanensis TaxID=2479545 RepID=A0ABT3GWB4_9RHOB|nr:membrane protein insertase YidC [Pararhodobacter zhoushanensis]MCW1931809.1 membrane protein insertase YidC [Pararhodobacter zhoushanensis]